MPLNKAGFNLISSLLFLGLAKVNVTHLRGKCGMNSRDCSFLQSSCLFCSTAFVVFQARTFHMNYEQILHLFLAMFKQQVLVRARACTCSLCEKMKFCPVWDFFFLNQHIIGSQSYTNIFKCTNKMTISHFISLPLVFILVLLSYFLVQVFELYHLCFYSLHLHPCVLSFFSVHIPYLHISNYPSVFPFRLIVSSVLIFNCYRI